TASFDPAGGTADGHHFHSVQSMRAGGVSSGIHRGNVEVEGRKRLGHPLPHLGNDGRLLVADGRVPVDVETGAASLRMAAGKIEVKRVRGCRQAAQGGNPRQKLSILQLLKRGPNRTRSTSLHPGLVMTE